MAETLDRDTLKALSTDTRQDIVKMLSKRPYTASEISKILKKHVTTVTEHLAVLEKSGLIKRKDSQNKWVYYALTDRGGKLFKPTYYSWVITLSVALVVVAFISMYQAFIIVPSGTQLSQEMMTAQQSIIVDAEGDQLTIETGKPFEIEGSEFLPVIVKSSSGTEVIDVDTSEKTDSQVIPIDITDINEGSITVDILEPREIINGRKVIPLKISRISTGERNADEIRVNIIYKNETKTIPVSSNIGIRNTGINP